VCFIDSLCFCSIKSLQEAEKGTDGTDDRRGMGKDNKTQEPAAILVDKTPDSKTDEDKGTHLEWHIGHCLRQVVRLKAVPVVKMFLHKDRHLHRN